MKLFSRKFYGRLNFDQFMALDEAMHWIGFSISAYPPEYGNATCQNCRSVVDVGYDETTLEYGKRHREICGYANLPDIYRRYLSQNLAAIEHGVMSLPSPWKE